jgi:hypothetical protein
MAEPPQALGYDEVRIENISGGVFYDEIPNIEDKWRTVLTTLRRISDELRKSTGWRGPWRVESRSFVDAETLEKLVAAGVEEGANLATEVYQNSCFASSRTS